MYLSFRIHTRIPEQVKEIGQVVKGACFVVLVCGFCLLIFQDRILLHVLVSLELGILLLYPLE